MPTLLVLVGGGLGAVARYWVGLFFKDRGWADQFPWHTFLINVLGSFVLGISAGAFKQRPDWHHFVGVGICGGFTTFSAFSLETLLLLEQNRVSAAAGYVLGSVSAGLVGAWCGLQLVRD